MTQLIDDVLRQDEEKRRIRDAAYTLFPPEDVYYDDMTRRVYDAADVQAGQTAAMRANPFTAWMGALPGLDVAEFAMPPAWDRGEYSAPTARYRAL